MKIGINVSFVRKENTGIGQYTLNLVKEILNLEESQSHSFILFFEDKINWDFLKGRSNVKKKVIATPLYKRDDLVRKTAWERIFLPKEVKKEGVGFFFTPYNSVSHFPLLPHVMTVHDAVPKVYQKTYLNNFRKSIYANQTEGALKRASKLITVSEYSKKDLIKYYGVDPSRVVVVKNGVSPDFFPREDRRALLNELEKMGINDPYLFYIGGLEKRKNLELLLRAFQKLTKSYANLLEKRKLVIAGEIWEHIDPLVTDVKRLANELGIADRVIFTGKVTEKEKITLFNGADLFVFPSLYEGFGMPVLEAMASGTPVLTSSRSALPELCQEAAEYFNPDREDELIQQLSRLLADHSRRSFLSERGLIRSREFSWEKAARETWDTFREFIVEKQK
jgi:glycosyltransferase involved in cell wall biosynthesis